MFLLQGDPSFFGFRRMIVPSHHPFRLPNQPSTHPPPGPEGVRGKGVCGAVGVGVSGVSGRLQRIFTTQTRWVRNMGGDSKWACFFFKGQLRLSFSVSHQATKDTGTLIKSFVGGRMDQLSHADIKFDNVLQSFLKSCVTCGVSGEDTAIIL